MTVSDADLEIALHNALKRGERNATMTDNSPATDELIAQIEADLDCPIDGFNEIGIHPDHLRSLITRIHAETAKNSGEPGKFWYAVHSVTGVHIGLWDDAQIANRAASGYEGGTVTVLREYSHTTDSAEPVGYVSERTLSVLNSGISIQPWINHIKGETYTVPLYATPANSRAELFGPFGWLNGHRGLNKENWNLESDPLENSEEYFAIPLYSLVDPFKEIGKDGNNHVTANSRAMEWHDGSPQNPWDKEWFIAVTTYGDRVVLKALPEEFTYDFKTADDTYIMRDKIKKWMQFPDSQFVAPEVTPANSRAEAIGVKPLEWSEPAKPNGEYAYDHCKAKTAWGEYSIEWKSWKPTDAYCVYAPSWNEQFLTAQPNLEDAKAAAQADYEQRIRSALLQQEGE